MAGTYPIDISEVKTAIELLKSHSSEQVKQHTVVDSQGRPKFVFTTYIGAQNGDPCMVDEYVYINATSTQVINRQERVYKWKSAWETGALAFTFNPATSYDADGDGVL
ncbi:MAG TPA: hypothetical protein VFF49_04765 [Thermodesulfobacteriota bacterium]|nr:hypothetical protein [Thermodesulfobacteriota bacterium]